MTARTCASRIELALASFQARYLFIQLWTISNQEASFTLRTDTNHVQELASLVRAS